MPELKEKQSLDKSYLSTVSPADARFESHKATSQEMARLYGLDTEDGLVGFMSGKRFVMFSRYSTKIDKCGAWLRFVEAHDGIRLIDARVRYLTRLFAFDHGEFVVVVRCANTSCLAAILVSYSLQ